MVNALQQDADRVSMNISPSDYIPWDEVEESPQKRFAQKYVDEITEGKYLRTLHKDRGGAGLILYSDNPAIDMNELVVSLLGTYCLDDEFLIPPDVAGRDMSYAYPITHNRPAEKRGRVLSASEFVELSREFGDGDIRDEYKELKSKNSPLFLALLDLEQVRGTEWAKEVLYSLLGRRISAGRSTIITTNLSAHDVSHRFGDYTGRLLLKRFVYPRNWVA